MTFLQQYSIEILLQKKIMKYYQTIKRVISVFMRRKEDVCVLRVVNPDHKLFSVVTECHCRLMSIMGYDHSLSISHTET